MSERTSVLLGEVMRVKHGYAFPGEGFSDEPVWPTLVTPGNFAIGGGFKATKPKTFSGEYPDEYVLAPGDLIITMTDLSKEGATLGLPATVPNDAVYLHNQRIGLVEVIDPSVVNLAFLHYYLRTDGYRAHILGTATGSTVRHTSPSRISTYKADLPCLVEQRAVATVLGALDDKIAANTRVAQTSEALLAAEFAALRLDEEPGDSRSAATLEDVVVLNPAVPRPSEAEPVYVDMQKLPILGSSITDWARRPAKGGARFENGDTLLARITPCLENRKTGYVDFLDEGQVGLGSTEYVVMRARPGVPAELPYFIATSERFRSFAIRHMSGTSGRQRVSVGSLADFTITAPDTRTLEAFGRKSTKLFALIKSQRDENRTLSQLRDALLPQLMSGKIRVKDAEKTAEEVL